MTDTVPAHRRPRNARGIVRRNGDHVNAHDISKSHGITSGERARRSRRYRLNSCVRAVNRSRLQREEAFACRVASWCYGADGMATPAERRVLVATDGSLHAEAAIATALHFPWPARTRVRVISARRTGAEYRRSILLAALDRAADQAAESARQTLSRRWPDLEVEIADEPPIKGILAEAKRFRADVIVVGWRGHGAVRRLLMGSVSRGVVRGATCAVLVVRRSQRVRTIVIGIDGSDESSRALTLVAQLVPPDRGRVTLVSAVELATPPSRGRVPGAASIAREIRRQNTARARAATKELNRAASALRRIGWQTRTKLVHGEPLRDLLRAVAANRAQLLVVGARGTSGIRQLLLGSVAEGALNQSPVSVLVAR
jgi:nucleotide-binding universal stress UspA family protein